MRKFYAFFLMLFVLIGSTVMGQTSTITTTFTNNNGSGQVTFNFQNTNGYPVRITEIASITGTTGSVPVQAWFNTTPVNSTTAPPAVTTANGWTQFGSATIAGVANTTTTTPQTFMTGLTLVVPAGATYGIVVSASSLRYSTLTAGSYTISNGGGNIITGTNIGWAGAAIPAVFANNDRGFIGSITFESVGPCTSPPVPGTVTTTRNPACSGANFVLGLSGGTGGTGQTFQWQSSPDNVSYTNIPGATGGTLTIAQTTSTYYRATVTCGTPVNSAGLLITTPPLVSGNFTINNGLPTGGTNFQTFADAVNYMKCGINAPITFNVQPGSGPYSEQVTIPAIGGASAVNKIVFNGNGVALNFNSTNTNERAAIKLDGADFVTINNFIISGTGTATTDYNFGIHLLNDADNNTIKKCTINLTAASTSTNFAGIVLSGSAASATTAGSNADFNVIDSNTINGGYYGITVLGATGTPAKGNRLSNNILQDWYFYGVYASNTDSLIVEKNDVNRLVRSANTSTFNGIFFTGLSEKASVSKNRIHDPFAGILTSTSAAYGIYFTASDATAGRENVVSNNLIYNFNGGGIIYALYNSSSDGVFYYHNTVVLDDAAYAGTAATRGFYQITAAVRIDIRNNIISIGRGGAGEKYVLYFGTTTSTIVSNNNVLNNTSGSGTNGIGFYGSGFATLANWKTANANAFDQASVTADPLFANPGGGDFKPSSALINDIGSNVGIATDILDVARNLASPDPGAYEFSLGNCTNPPTPGQAVSSVTSVCIGSTFTLNLQNNNTGSGQTYQWESSPNNSAPWTAIGSASTSPVFATAQLTSLYYRAQVKCAAGTAVPSVSVLVTSPALVSGTFTINNGLPTGGTNFQTFADALNFIKCGVNGPVVFNITPGSPYSEQVVIPKINGASLANKITFEGNGSAINFNSTVASARAAILLDGASNIIVKNLVITGTGTATTDYNFGIQLTNGADSNTIKNCTINLTAASTSANFAGIVLSGSTSSATTGGSNADFNVIDSNIINGGYYGITVLGAAGTPAKGNRITNNKIQDWYFYGVYAADTDSLLVEKNDINRLVRSVNTSTFNGIFFTGLSEKAMVSKNRIHDPFAGITSTSAAYGIYFTGSDATVGRENVISNNLIYNFNGGGIIYGLYNSSSDGTRFYHNSVVLNDASYTGTSVTRGFYQITAADRVDLKNNLITIGRGGTGIKHALYFATTTSTIVSNNNLLFMNAAAGTNEIGFYSTGFATLANWQTANTNAYDQQSRSVDPMFATPNGPDFIPGSSLADNMGVPVGITTDIRDTVRQLTTPDAGAYEFSTLTSGVNMSAMALLTPVIQSSGCYAPTEPVTIRIRNSSINTINFATNPVTVTTEVTGAVNQVLSAVVNSGTLASDATLDVLMTTSLNMTAAGVYTINARTAVGGDVNTENDAMGTVTRTKQALTAGTATGPSGYCVSTPANIVLSATGTTGTSALQWVQSTTAIGGYTNISGANTTPFTITAAPTQTQYYKLVARCGTLTDSSAVVTVVYNNPQITGTTPAGRCGSGTVTLSAAGSTGTTLEWFQAATGGAPLATGSTFVTPVINTNTTYFVAAKIAGGSGGASPILVTEIDLGTNDQVEIQNVSGSPVDVTGWKVAVSNSYTDINSVNTIIQTLSGVMNPGEIKTWTDASAGPNYWGNNILYNPGAFPSFTGWAVILDNNNNVVDMIFMNWPAANIQGASLVIGSATITVGTKWSGNGFDITSVGATQSVSRQGTSDNESATDFSIQNLSIGTTNPVMTLPFTGFGCSSARTAVVASVTPASSAAAGVIGSTECASANIAGSEILISHTDCDPIVTIKPGGSSPINGSVNACVTIASTVQNATTGEPYLQRSYNITPATNPTTASAQLTLYYLQSEFNAFNAVRGNYPALPTAPNDSVGIENFRVTKFSGTGTTPGAFTGGGTLINPADDSIVWNAVAGRWQVTFSINGFSGFFVHSGSTVLPVTITNFKGERSGSVNKLDWTTATEVNNAGFELQRSSDGSNFTTVSFTPTRAINGSSTSAITYTYDDARPLAGNNYYRLKQVDKDGKFSYSTIVLIKGAKVNNTMISSIYPNPAKTELNVVVSAPASEKVTLMITDVSGRVVLQQQAQLITGDNQLRVPLQLLQAGTYMIKTICASGCEAAIQKFVKQ